MFRKGGELFPDNFSFWNAIRDKPFRQTILLRRIWKNAWHCVVLCPVVRDAKRLVMMIKIEKLSETFPNASINFNGVLELHCRRPCKYYRTQPRQFIIKLLRWSEFVRHRQERLDVNPRERNSQIGASKTRQSHARARDTIRPTHIYI